MKWRTIFAVFFVFIIPIAIWVYAMATNIPYLVSIYEAENEGFVFWMIAPYATLVHAFLSWYLPLQILVGVYLVCVAIFAQMRVGD
jgi:hypothetical protein